jgi:hypothetical protein
VYRTVIIPAIFALGFTLAGTTHATAVAGPTPQVTINARYPCGYDGYYGGEQPLYNHCGRSDVVIRVHHFWLFEVKRGQGIHVRAAWWRSESVVVG